MQLSDFNYHLPDDLIAQTPCYPRDHSRLLVLERKTGCVSHKRFYDLPQFVEPGDTLVFNNTRVIPARLIGARTDSGGKVEVFLLTRLTGNTWEALVKPGKRARPGMKIHFSNELSCEILDVTEFGGRIVSFQYQGIFEEILDRLGETPLPPYIKEKLEDSERYQTVYAKERGSAAAPTAGLHFTDQLLTRLQEMGVNLAFVTLHVGLGTFRPVAVSNIREHVMHREYYSLDDKAAQLINATKENGKKIIAIGTTSVRTIESAVVNGRVTAGSGWTDIFIYPGYRFQIVDKICTNFHLPESTLIMLISAFAGQEMIMQAYKEAVRERYRFFSFGDAMLII